MLTLQNMLITIPLVGLSAIIAVYYFDKYKATSLNIKSK